MGENEKPRIGFIGVGVMGQPMARNLLKAGYFCTIYDVNPAPVAALVAEGARSVGDVRTVAAASDILITMVVDDAQFSAILFEPGQAVQELKEGAIVMGMSTMSVAMVQSAAARLRERGISYVDAPVSGGEVGAINGALSIMVGGPSEVVERCQPVLQTLGSNVYHVGQKAGDGQAVKMINQLMVCVHNAIAAEALVFGERAGLDRAMLHEIITKSAGNSWIFADRGQRMVSEQFTPPKSALKILVKDLGFVMETANDMGHPLLLGGVAHQLYKMAHAKGWDNLDDSILVRLMEEITSKS
ncbi:3-hydroxyisobutyrate dehydrogenase [Dictyobacter sp. S3.2.2.5]|uniref:3-hydroxyisobutyrate dehydrogenase n=1 Tax=Dictyobacter halimunensis TaxID=3026934 RepID=A0ABQ6G0R0_9CHLR|nr:3-hydroxyisobutyrate dehydrogenase [Dictyobacter sp. S3.2.2.5]